MSTLLTVLLVLALALVVIVRGGRWGKAPVLPPHAPPEDDPPPDGERVPAGLAPSVTRTRRVHRAELLPRVERSVAPLQVHTAFDPERGMFRAWAGARAFDDAPEHLRAERTTELGALRCLLNANGAPRGNFWLVKTERSKRARRRKRAKPKLAIARAA